MTDSGTIRRLAAIALADVAGYSRLMGQDEEGTLAALKLHRRELIDPKIEERTKNLEVVRVDAERNLLFIRGAVPGPKGGYIQVQTARTGVKKAK